MDTAKRIWRDLWNFFRNVLEVLWLIVKLLFWPIWQVMRIFDKLTS